MSTPRLNVHAASHRPARVQVDTTVLGCSPNEAKEKPYIASMGIYVFKRAVLCNLLAQNPNHLDFGGDVIPHAQQNGSRRAVLPRACLRLHEFLRRLACAEVSARANLRADHTCVINWGQGA